MAARTTPRGTPATTRETPKRGRPKGSEAKVRPPLDVAAIEVRKADQDTMRAFRKQRDTRKSDKEQQMIDRLVAQAYDQWVTAGKPEEWEEKNGLYVKLPEDQLETLTWRVHRAGTFFNMSVRFGDVKTEEGYSETVFTATDKREKSAEAETASS